MYSSITITGVGVLSPLGVSCEGLYEAIEDLHSRAAVMDVGQFFQVGLHKSCEIDIKSLNIHPREGRIMDRHSLMLLKASEEAYRAGRLSDYQPEDIGFFASIGMVDYRIEDLLASVKKSMNGQELNYSLFFKKAYQEIYPLWPLSMLNNIALCQVAIRLSIRGENCVFSPHSDSSLYALHEAAMSIASGHCRAALAGGVSEVISPNSLIRYVLANTNRSRIREQCSTIPYPMAEGCAIFSLEAINEAKQSGIAMIAGFGSAFGFDALSGGPTIEAILLSMSEALLTAEIKPSEVDMIFTHYDISTDDGHNERMAIERLFGKAVITQSTKSTVGDMLSGAGAFDTAVAVSAIQTRGDADYALINAFSVEGNTASMLIKRPD